MPGGPSTKENELRSSGPGREGSGKRTIHLMCKQRHVALYERQGYGYVRPSPSDHGGMSWHEMVMAL